MHPVCAVCLTGNGQSVNGGCCESCGAADAAVGTDGGRAAGCRTREVADHGWRWPGTAQGEKARGPQESSETEAGGCSKHF